MSTLKRIKPLKKKRSLFWTITGGLAGLLVLCCVGMFSLAVLDRAVRQAGLLPTYTPTLTRTPTPLPTATGTPAPSATPAPINTPEPTPLPAATSTPDLRQKVQADVDLLANQMTDLRIALKEGGDFNAKKAAIVAPVEAVIVTADRLKEEAAGLSPDARRQITETALDCRNAATTVKQGFDELKPNLITLASTMFDNCDLGLGLATVKLALE